MAILVAGFSAFPGAPSNPCEALALSLQGARTTSGTPISVAVLPVEWDRSWPLLQAAIEESGADAVLLFGLSARVGRLRIETEAANARELGQPDAAGRFPFGPGVEDGPERLYGTLPLSAAASALSGGGIPFEISRDAGRYLCNDTYYHLCRFGGAGRLRHWGFVHTPLTDELLGDWALAGALPDPCRTIPAAQLREAALLLAGVLDGVVA